MERKTPLYDFHYENKGKIILFSGYLLPVEYKTGLVAEHLATRRQCGIFDVSHMGEIIITGANALNNLNYLLTNDFTNMNAGQVRYSLMCNDNGGVVDDLLVYKYDDEKFLLVVNASNKQKDTDWIQQRLNGDVTLTDASESYAQIALQGPLSKEILASITEEEDIPQKYYSFLPNVKVAGILCDISKTGYTGETGYEILCAPDCATALWNALLNAGQEFGLIPCGLGARDTLRLEAGMPLYGHELDDSITPFESCLGFAVKMDKEDFIGKSALLINLLKRKRFGLKVTGRGIIRENCEVYKDGKLIGKTTSGTLAPFLNIAVAVALLDIEAVQIGDKVEAEVRGRKIEAEVIPYVFYKPLKKKT